MLATCCDETASAAASEISSSLSTGVTSTTQHSYTCAQGLQYCLAHTKDQCDSTPNGETTWPLSSSCLSEAMTKGRPRLRFCQRLRPSRLALYERQPRSLTHQRRSIDRTLPTAESGSPSKTFRPPVWNIAVAIVQQIP